MARTTTLLLVAFVATLCLVSPGWANQRRIAVLQPDDELLRAVSLALSPWGLETMTSDAPLPGASQPEAARVASQLARQLEVEALVWITKQEQGSLLWVFDVRTGDVTTRQVPQTPPFDGASAAAVALSVKTVLRASFVAPPEERFGARTPLPPPPPPPPEERFAPRESVVAAEVGAGGHWLSESALDVRFEVAAVLWIPSARRLGLSFEFSTGPGLSIESADYDGSYRELVAGGKLRFRPIHLPRFSLVVALGGAAHFATLEGTLTQQSLDRDVKRLNGSLDFDTLVNLHVTRVLYLGASLGAAYFPTYRRYLVDGDPVLAPWPVTANLTGYAGVELF